MCVRFPGLFHSFDLAATAAAVITEHVYDIIESVFGDVF